VHFIFGGNSFNDFPEIVQTTEITTKIEKTFLVFSPYFLNGRNAAAATAASLIRHWPFVLLKWPCSRNEQTAMQASVT